MAQIKRDRECTIGERASGEELMEGRSDGGYRFGRRRGLKTGEAYSFP